MGWILIIAVVVLMAISQNEKKNASAGLDATRTFSSSEVVAGNTLIATYHPTTLNYFAIIEDVPVGWQPSKALSPDGKVRATGDGTDITITWTAPATTGSAIFTGQYFVYPDVNYTSFTSQTLQVCSNHASSACDGGHVYWYTSCSDKQDLKQSCTANACTSFGATFCTSLTVQKSRTCYTAGCSAAACTNTPYTDTQTETTAPYSSSGLCAWQCSGGACQQNTAADTNYNGCVADIEFPIAVSNWKQQTGGITDIIFPSVVSKWKTQENC